MFVDVALTFKASIPELLLSNVDGQTFFIFFFRRFPANSMAVASVRPKPPSKTLPIRLKLEVPLNGEDK